ncbi:MAG: CapA family protein [Bacteroidota bacterium]|nr:CapA family protein [Bacteroidota bacterium]
MFRKIYTILLVSASFLVLHGQDHEELKKKLSLLFIGDIMGHEEQIWSAENRETHTYSYDTVFSFIREEISEADIAVANFEVTLAGAPYSGYPAFSSPAELAVACRNAGIDVMVTANNHAADKGKRGIISTINKLDSLGIPHTGTFLDQAQRDSLFPMLISKNGIKLAMLNYTYGTNGITVPPPVIVNTLDRNLIAGDIRKAKSMNPDAIIVFVHWGTEYDTIPSSSQTSLAGYLFEHGADIIIGSHPHVIQKMIWTKCDTCGRDRIVVYSLGNFVSNQRRPKTDGGTMVRIELEKDDSSLVVTDAGYYLTWVYTPIENYRKRFFILPCSKFEDKTEFFTNQADYLKMKSFIKGARDLLYNQNMRINELIFSGNRWLYSFLPPSP